MHTGQCLCGAVTFEVDEIVGPFELCHCSRCIKTTGSAFAATVGAKANGFRITSGSDLIRTFDLPIEPERHIYIEFKANWDHIHDDLPTFSKQELAELRGHHSDT